ncbi:hypothetical protein B0H14DRAFT_3486048 [Mycena olivaceomarginata]|nr:hypothetical protein B0H14DRAFT_3486048 [Mycena olivaceomarginata]
MPSTHARRESAIHIAENVSIGHDESERESKAFHMLVHPAQHPASNSRKSAHPHPRRHTLLRRMHAYGPFPKRATFGSGDLKPAARLARGPHSPSAGVPPVHRAPNGSDTLDAHERARTSTPVRAHTEKAPHPLRAQCDPR